MLHVETGKIKFFAFSGGWGFIIPDKGGEEVFFHIRDFAGLAEVRDGELEFQPFQGETTLYDFHMPQSDELVVFSAGKGQGRKGPRALNWLYRQTYDQAVEVLVYRRGSRDNYDVRVLTGTGAVSWEGTKNQFHEKLNSDFPEVADSQSQVEKMEITGKWTVMPHPRRWHHRYMQRA